MPIQDILKSIDNEISQLQLARTLLAGDPVLKPLGKRRGRPKGSKNKPPSVTVAKKAANRTMSAEGKARIAAAQTARWANQKRIASIVKKTVNASSSVAAKKSSKPREKKAPVKKTSASKKSAAPKGTSIGQSSNSSVEASVA